MRTKGTVYVMMMREARTGIGTHHKLMPHWVVVVVVFGQTILRASEVSQHDISYNSYNPHPQREVGMKKCRELWPAGLYVHFKSLHPATGISCTKYTILYEGTTPKIGMARRIYVR
jgi:hypothetical protein